MHDSLRTFETLYWFMGLAIASAVVGSAGLLASHWFKSVSLSQVQVANAVALMGVTLAVQWPTALYLGGLLGLQRQVEANVLSSTFATLRAAGAVLLLAFVAPSIELFFAWQVLISAAQTIALRLVLRRALPSEGRPGRFQGALLKANYAFALDLTVITVLAALLTQTDKIILSLIVPLDQFGYYALAGTVAGALYTFAGPVFNAAFPRLVNDVARNLPADLSATYHDSSQVLALLLAPPAATLIVFAPEAMHAWIGDIGVTTATAGLVRILALGTALNGLLNVPYALMLATGLTRLPMLLNAVALLVLAPLIVYLTGQFGTTGGALAWLALNAGYMVVAVPLLHARVLRGAAWRWYSHDVGPPALGAITGVLMSRFLLADSASRPGTILILAIASCAAVVGALVGSHLGRSFLAQLWRGPLHNGLNAIFTRR
jgi:O-antigen/teichoic acid export membrane protein